MFLDEK